MSGLLRRVDLPELRAFCVAVELGSLGRAARLMRVSQPALSKRMRELELLAGGPLLARSTRGVTPTAAGERLYAQARPLLEQAERVEGVLEGLHDEHAPIRLAAGHTIAEYLLPAPLADYQQHLGRHLALELVIANSAVVHELVSEGRADFGVAAADVEPAAGGARAGGARAGGAPLEQRELCEDEVVVAVSPGHRWATYEEIPLEEFLATPMVMRDPSANTRRVVDAVLRERGMRLAAPLTEVGSTGAALAAAVSGEAPALLSRLAIPAHDGRMLARRVVGLCFRRRFVLLWGAREALGPEARALIDYLADALVSGGD
jgi:DNA-binding transcriptional LysR family regulator